MPRAVEKTRHRASKLALAAYSHSIINRRGALSAGSPDPASQLYFSLTGNQMVAYCRDGRRRSFPGVGGCQPPAAIGPAAPEQWPDAGRAMSGNEYDAPGGREASVDPGGGKSRVVEAP